MNKADDLILKGEEYQKAGRMDEALEMYSDAVWLKDRGNHHRACNNAGIIYQERGDYEKARRWFWKAVKFKPKYPQGWFNRGIEWLRSGNLKDGWRGYKYRHKLKDRPQRRFVQPEWSGQPLEGKRILVYAEQGFGDTIQFVRYLEHLQLMGADVIFECQKELIPLMREDAGLPIVKPFADCIESARGLDYDYQIALMDLPGALGLNDNGSLCGSVPYIFADKKIDSPWLAQEYALMTEDIFRVGIIHQGNAGHLNDKNRSINRDMFRHLFEVPGVELYNFQQIFDFKLMSSCMMKMDLIISVDTAAAHLAGALGLPVWTLLPYVADWRWFDDTVTTPWYPSMRLFKQEISGDWSGVFSRVVEYLKQLTKGRD